jgi:KRAB domain-containing zinc finger protein
MPETATRVAETTPVVETATPALKRKRSVAEPVADDSSAEKKQKTADYKCWVCEKLCKTDLDLTEHIRGVHRYKKNRCSYCGKCFKTKQDLTKHVYTHTGETPFECDACGKRFAQKGALVTHSRVHTGEKPYKCKECEKCFSTSSAMRRHEKKHGNPAKEFMCGTCYLLLARKDKLTQHLETHVDKDGNPIRVECKVEGCDEVSTSNKSVKEHRASHSNIRCAECDIGFSKKSNLTKHMNKFHG